MRAAAGREAPRGGQGASSASFPPQDAGASPVQRVQRSSKRPDSPFLSKEYLASRPCEIFFTFWRRGPSGRRKAGRTGLRDFFHVSCTKSREGPPRPLLAEARLPSRACEISFTFSPSGTCGGASATHQPVAGAYEIFFTFYAQKYQYPAMVQQSRCPLLTRTHAHNPRDVRTSGG
jgi:hypothetical protein